MFIARGMQCIKKVNNMYDVNYMQNITVMNVKSIQKIGYKRRLIWQKESV